MYAKTWTALNVFALLAWLTGTAAAAPIYDNLDTAANFTGWATSSATANGDGTVTLTRNQGNIDAGVDWFSGSGNISLTPDHNRLEVEPIADAANDYYTISLVFLEGVNFSGEVYVLTDSNSTVPFVVPDVAAIAPTGADNYFVRFRIQPFEQAGSTFRFTQINAIPEPALAPVAAAGVLAIGWLRRRR